MRRAVRPPLNSSVHLEGAGASLGLDIHFEISIMRTRWFVRAIESPGLFELELELLQTHMT
jgi:hypothetical protein